MLATPVEMLGMDQEAVSATSSPHIHLVDRHSNSINPQYTPSVCPSWHVECIDRIPSSATNPEHFAFQGRFPMRGSVDILFSFDNDT